MAMMAKRINGKKAQQLTEKGALLIDMRDPVSFRDGSIPGAVNLTLRRVSTLVREPKTRNLIFFGENENDDTLKAAINYAYQFGFTEVFSLGCKENWNK